MLNSCAYFCNACVVIYVAPFIMARLGKFFSQNLVPTLIMGTWSWVPYMRPHGISRMMSFPRLLHRILEK